MAKVQEQKQERAFGDKPKGLLIKALFYLLMIITVTYVTLYGVVKYVLRFLLWPVKYFSASAYEKVLDFGHRITIPFSKLVVKFKERFPDISAMLEETFHGQGDKADNNRVFFYFLLPALFSFILMVIVPFILGIYYSLTDFRGIGDPNLIWFENYRDIFTDFRYYYSFYRTALYSILNIIAINVVAFALAVLVTQKLKIKNLMRAGFFMPNLIGGLVLGYIFQFVYSQAVKAIGAWDLIVKIFGEPIWQDNMLTSGATNSLIAIIIVVTWQYAGYIMMIYIAAIQNIPQQLVEASKIDGANAFQRLRTITLPLVAQAFTVAMFLTLTTSFKQFDTIFSMTGGGPTDQVPGFFVNLFGLTTRPPVPTLDLMAVNIYNEAFAFSNFGVGQAKAIVFFIILLVISLVQVYYSKRREVEL
jgi:raffinose/stachyose/melibiose transport system permease protein